MTRQVPLITIIGKSRAGKTTLMENLITELKRRGYRVGTIKHHSHPGFEIDQPGKDSWRHAQAGSDHVVIASPDRIASYRSLEHELALDDIACGMTDVDIILTEGYLQAGKPTIQVIREASGLELIGPPEQCFAIATDAQLAVETPCYGLNDFMGLSNLLERLFLSETSARSPNLAQT